ncbi:hypothetical protein [Gimesia chilikensis]|uniref:Uncharacterized protein n=1 Tax=Gimesia chilikensis TaxID=2605989 RepID=A0A517PPN2_9PLAN|nr:hypothetical protein [Gimesia chilikensis]QDT21334.1 hypothetical protein HG66A1_31330 [Gimesia chilikensis]
MMTQVSSAAGDLISISHEDGTESYAVLLFKSERVSGEILLGVFDRDISGPAEVDLHFGSLLYTYDTLISEGEWKIVGHIDVPNAIRYSRRLDGGLLWEGDQQIVSEETEQIPVMRIAGTGIAADYLHYLRNGGEDSAFYRTNTRMMKAFLGTLEK